MKITAKMVAAPLAGVLALGVGVVAGQAASTPNSSGTNYAQVFINDLAKILHMTPTQTQNSLKQAELQTIDQMLKDGKITKAQADAMKSRVNNGQGLGFGFGPRFGHGGFPADRTLMNDLKTAEVNAVAKALGLSVSDLRSQLRSGKTLSDLESAKKVSDATVRNAARSAAKGVLDKAVKAGTITQDQEDAILNKIGSGPLLFGGRFHGFRGPGAPSQSPAPGLYTPGFPPDTQTIGI